ncbi:unnamed protein product [Cylicostephanus goldi]|uniref:Uncharacterized protein n=1 Tax=Cylicostephanus goldi TaxID=71465 RepID=A0A3P7N3C0_CYLGO|nr:unnamed protein product [Cylicostephanus goldi]
MLLIDAVSRSSIGFDVILRECIIIVIKLFHPYACWHDSR